MKTCFDLAIVGSGFGGSLLAMIARRLGRSVILLEKGRHPRFVIGESSTPLANLLLEDLARRYDLPRLLPLAKWGTWQRHHPEIGCGLKRGFTFYHHPFDRPFASDSQRRNQLLVAASPHDEIADTHWYRPDFDHFFVQQAQAAGVDYVDELALDKVDFSAGHATVVGRRRGRPVEIGARFLVDASGPRGFLYRALGLPEQPFECLPKTQALYNHFTGVRLLAETAAFDRSESPPYPVDDAAVHHVFDGGWIWVLRFNNGLTSAGVAATTALANPLGFADGAPAWDRLLERLPAVRDQFANAGATLPWVHQPDLSFRSRQVVGPKWALLPSAAGFVDPLLSTGFPLTLLGIERLARAMEEDWDSDRWTDRLRNYQNQTLAELEAAARLVGALYANMNRFDVFVSLSLIYFAAASYGETSRRLGQPELAGSFLLHDHPVFGPRSRHYLEQAHDGKNNLGSPNPLEALQAILAPINVAGLGDSSRRNWYPVCADDLLNAAGKLGASRTQIEQLLRRTGFTVP